MESGFKDALDAHINELFPGFRIREIKATGKNPDTGKFRTETYEAVIGSGDLTRSLFIKRFSKWFVENKKGDIAATVRMSGNQEFNVPKIYGFFGDIRSFITERAEGNGLFGVLVRGYTNPMNRDAKDRVSFYVRKVARSIALVQNSAAAKTKRFSYRSFAIERGPEELARLVDGSRKLSDIVAGLEGRKIEMSRGFNDIKMGHVLVSGDNIKIIDFIPFSYKWSYINPVAFSTGIELAQKIPAFRRRDFLSLRKAFYDEYGKTLKNKLDMELIEKMEILKKCEVLSYFRSATGRMPLKHKIASRMDMRYLSKQLEEYL